MTVAETLAEFLLAVRPQDLPERTMDLAAMIVASTLASAACGRHIDSARIIRDIEVERGGRADASVWFEPRRKLPVVAAARVNALMSDAAASDDSDLRNIVHCGTPLTATSLAIAEPVGAPGTAVLAAIVAGYEAAGRIGEAIIPRFDHRGHHGCMGATFGATVAAARLQGLDARQAAHALALTATSIGGLAKAAATSVAREYHAGLATMLGIEAAQAAKRGYTGELAIFEGERGFCRLFGGAEADWSGITRDLGRDWDIATDMAVKLVPGGHPFHAFGEAAANAAREGDIAPGQIAAIIVSRPGLTALPGPAHPRDLIDMAHSPAYFTAAGARDKHFGWEHASPAKIADPVIHALIDKVRVGPPPTERVADYRQGATVRIETTDGRAAASTVHIPKGAACLGLGWADIEAKFRALAQNAPMTPAQVEASLAAIRGLREAPDVAGVLAGMA
ncbi:MAG: MmgE/PrpD family protein [Hyphomicrobiaceae bacterium]|nr:MmgE/PrpD family protein [Hyphomicrobiaceae bacterium]